jgi:hypothetical protein
MRHDAFNDTYIICIAVIFVTLLKWLELHENRNKMARFSKENAGSVRAHAEGYSYNCYNGEWSALPSNSPLDQSSSSSSSCLGTGPLLDPFRSHTPSSFFSGLPAFLFHFGM